MLGCIQPMSSPMMKRILGFCCGCCCCCCCWAGRCICCCCAAAGILAAMPPATNASRAGQSFRMTFMENLLTFLVRGANETTPQGIGLLQRPVVFTGESLKATVQVLVSAMQMHTVAQLRPQQMASRRAQGRVPI